MANKKFLVPLGLVSLASDPASGTEGSLYYNNVSDTIRLYKNGAWADLVSAGNLPSGGATGQILAKSSNTDYAVEWIENYADYTETVKLRVKNDGTRALYKGQPVYVTGSDGTNVLVGRSSNVTEGGSSKTIGLLTENLATNGQGFVVKEGKLGTLDTSAAGTVGDPVWLGVDGALIYGLSNKPSAPAHLVYLGVVTKKNGSTGEIFVQVQNGFEIRELHDVGIGYTETITDNEVLAYDITSGTWINQTSVEAGLIDTSDNAQTKEGNLTINGDVTADTLDLNEAKITAEGSSISVNTPVLIDTFNGEIYRSAEYLLQLSQAGSYTTSKILIIHNGTNVSLTEYGTVSIGNDIDYSLSSSFSGNSLEITLHCPEATVNSVSFKYSKTLFDV